MILQKKVKCHVELTFMTKLQHCTPETKYWTRILNLNSQHCWKKVASLKFLNQNILCEYIVNWFLIFFASFSHLIPWNQVIYNIELVLSLKNQLRFIMNICSRFLSWEKMLETRKPWFVSSFTKKWTFQVSVLAPINEVPWQIYINHLCRVLREQVRAEVQLPPPPRLQPQGLLLPFQGQTVRWYRTRLECGPQAAWMLQARPGRSG